MHIKPMVNKILVVLEEIVLAEKVTDTGIVIPSTVEKDENMATVVSMGEGITMDLKVGDKILYDKGAGVPVEHEDDKYLMLFERDIMAMVNDE